MMGLGDPDLRMATLRVFPQDFRVMFASDPRFTVQIFSPIISSPARKALLALLTGLDLSNQAVRRACPLPDGLRACLRLSAVDEGSDTFRRWRKLKKAHQVRRELVSVSHLVNIRWLEISPVFRAYVNC